MTDVVEECSTGRVFGDNRDLSRLSQLLEVNILPTILCWSQSNLLLSKISGSKGH